MLSKKVKQSTALTHPRRDPFDDPTNIGNVLLRLGKINREQLMRAIGQRAQFDEMLLGSLLKQLGYVSEMDVAQALKIQAEMRQGNPLVAELDVLQAKMDESAAGARELSSSIKNVRATRRSRGDKSDVFFLPVVARARG